MSAISAPALAVASVLQYGGAHWAEVGPPLLAAIVYAAFYQRQYQTLAAQGRAPRRWRVAAFATGIVLLVAVQIGPADSLADQVLAFHMLQHIVIGDVCSLLIVLGLTGPMLQPLLQIRFTRPLRVLSHPLIALLLWAADLYAWHLPLLYQLAIRHDLAHALEHACLLWFGALLWLALIGPLPKPRWFAGWGEVTYIVLVRFIGAGIANALLWAQTVIYPVYRSTDAARGLNPLSDQNFAGGLMMIEQIVLTTLLLGWLFHRLASRDEERQSLLDFARDRGVELSDGRAARAASAGAGDRLRERIRRDFEERASVPDDRQTASPAISHERRGIERTQNAPPAGGA